MKRDQIEAKLTGILSELKTTLAEIASIGSSSSISCDEHGSRDMKYKEDDYNISFVRKDISLSKSRDLNSTIKNYTGVNNISSSDSSIDFLAEIKREEDEINQQKMKSLGMTLLMNDDNTFDFVGSTWHPVLRLRQGCGSYGLGLFKLSG